MITATFGKKLPSETYRLRHGIYGIILNEKNQIATIKVTSGYVLPGGGVEGSETHEICLKRECLEELGWDIEIQEFVGVTSNHYYSNYRQTFLHVIAQFYIARKLSKIAEPIEEDHELHWLDVETCLKNLYLEHQAWAVKRAWALSQNL